MKCTRTVEIYGRRGTVLYVSFPWPLFDATDRHVHVANLMTLIKAESVSVSGLSAFHFIARVSLIRSGYPQQGPSLLPVAAVDESLETMQSQRRMSECPWHRVEKRH